VLAATNSAEAGKLARCMHTESCYFRCRVGLSRVSCQGAADRAKRQMERTFLPLLHTASPRAVAVQMSAYTIEEVTSNGSHYRSSPLSSKALYRFKLRGLVEGFLSELPLNPDAMMPLAEIPWCG
jgi:hypothetical protein